MAGEWIKMRTNLWDDPRIANLCDITDQSEAAVIGALYWLWAMADEHTENGILPGLTLRAIDRKTGVQGIGTGLVSIGWLEDHPEGVRIVGFEEHNGSSAKKRCSTAKRVASHRGGNDDVTHAALQDEHASDTGALAREEKIREEEYTTTPIVVVVAPQSVAATPAEPKPKRSASGTRLAQDWFLPDTWGQWALQKYPHFTVEIIRDEATKFANHFRAKTGKDATKHDWYATWQNWLMSDICQKAHPPESGGGETNYQRSMRERVEQAAGSLAHIVAAKAPGAKQVQTPTPWEVAIENNARTTAIGMD